MSLKLSDKVGKAVERGLDRIAKIAQKHAKATKLFKGNSPGGLRQSIRVIKNGSYIRTVLADKWYADYVENGNHRGPNGWWIYPKKAKFLHFWWKGKEFFCKRVRAHGPLPFMKKAKESVEYSIISIMEQELKKVLY